MPDPAGLTLRELRDKPVTSLRDVGPRLEASLAELGIRNVLDLLEHYPRRYHDRTNVVEIASLAVGEEATVSGEIKAVRVRRPRRGRPIVELEVFDGTSYLRLTFFNQEYRSRLEEGTEVSVFGRVDQYRGRRQMVNPALDVLGRRGEATTGVLLPVYPQSGKAGIHSWQLRRLVGAALDRTRAAGSPTPSTSICARRGASWTAPPRTGGSISPARLRRRTRPGPGWPSTSSSASRFASSCTAARSNGNAPGSNIRSTGSSCRRSSTRSRSR